MIDTFLLAVKSTLDSSTAACFSWYSEFRKTAPTFSLSIFMIDTLHGKLWFATRLVTHWRSFRKMGERRSPVVNNSDLSVAVSTRTRFYLFPCSMIHLNAASTDPCFPSSKPISNTSLVWTRAHNLKLPETEWLTLVKWRTEKEKRKWKSIARFSAVRCFAKKIIRHDKTQYSIVDFSSICPIIASSF